MKQSDLVRLYKNMYSIRLTEKAILKGYKDGILTGTAHVCVGQEAVSVGITDFLTHNDAVFSNHRGHGHMLGMGVSPKALLYEVAGRDSGCCGGLGGSQHIASPDTGFMGSNGITGGGVPVAVGCALAKKLQGLDGIVVVFFGDGALSQGVVSEAMNMASIWKLPIVFVLENNRYAMSASSEDFIGGPTSDRASGFGLCYLTAFGMDVEDVHKIFKLAMHKAKNNIPVFMECMTYRFVGHSKSDRELYRDKREVSKWKAEDPLVRLSNKLPKKLVDEVESKIKDEIASICLELGFNL